MDPEHIDWHEVNPYAPRDPMEEPVSIDRPVTEASASRSRHRRKVGGRDKIGRILRLDRMGVEQEHGYMEINEEDWVTQDEIADSLTKYLQYMEGE